LSVGVSPPLFLLVFFLLFMPYHPPCQLETGFSKLFFLRRLRAFGGGSSSCLMYFQDLPPPSTPLGGTLLTMFSPPYHMAWKYPSDARHVPPVPPTCTPFDGLECVNAPEPCQETSPSGLRKLDSRDDHRLCPTLLPEKPGCNLLSHRFADRAFTGTPLLL